MWIRKTWGIAMKINSIKVKLNKKQLDTVMKAMRAVEHENKSEFYEACDQIAADTGTSSEDVAFYILCSTYKSTTSMLMTKGGVS